MCRSRPIQSHHALSAVRARHRTSGQVLSLPEVFFIFKKQISDQLAAYLFSIRSAKLLWHATHLVHTAFVFHHHSLLTHHTADDHVER